jgi:hypothetical protein
MRAIETGVSSQQSYSFTLSSSSSVSVSLTGLTRDFDCRVNSSGCTNRGGSADDSWSGTLTAGTHTVVVYPYGGGRGDYTLTVAVNDVNLVSVVSPLGSGPEEIVCKKDGEVIDCPTPNGTIVVVGDDPGPDPGPPPGTRPGEGDPPPEDGDDDSGGSGSDDDDDDEETQQQRLGAAVADAIARLEDCRVRNGDSPTAPTYSPYRALTTAQANGKIVDEITA